MCINKRKYYMPAFAQAKNPASLDRGNINRQTKQPEGVVRPRHKHDKVDLPTRRMDEKRVLFTQMTRAARKGLAKMVEGTRYEGKKDIHDKLRDGTLISGQLVTFEYFKRMCEGFHGEFFALGQARQGKFYPLHCSDNDDHAVKIAEAMKPQD
jgi:hypothetical protein